MTPEDQPVEVEATLLIRSARPEDVAAAVGRLTTLDAYALLPRPQQLIRDRYFDTPRRDLERLLLALRLRVLNGECFITLKGPGTRTASATERLELELPASAEAVERVLAELRVRGVTTGTSIDRGGDAMGMLAQVGLAVVQDRTTQRVPRAVVLPPADRVLAELAIDRVQYSFASETVVLHEIEIEAKAKTADVDSMVKILARAVPELREWPYSKLATGKAIEHGLISGRLNPREDGTLDPDAFDRVADLVRASDAVA